MAKSKPDTSQTENSSLSTSKKRTSKLPLYQQVADALRTAILSGMHPVGALLPTEDALCSQYSVSRYTVREALRLLREESLITSKRGAGTLVTLPPSSSTDIHQVMSINDLLTFADDTRFDIDAIRLVDVDKKTAQQLDVASGTKWLKVSGFRYRKDTKQPLCWTEYYINRDYAAIGRLLQRYTGPIFTLIEDFSGQRIAEVEQQISATIIPQHLYTELHTKPGSAALVVRRTYKAADNKILQVTINTHLAESFKHTMTMRRIKQQPN